MTRSTLLAVAMLAAWAPSACQGGAKSSGPLQEKVDEAAGGGLRPHSGSVTPPFCGEWSDSALDFEATVVSEEGEPLGGIAVRCANDPAPIAVSAEDGAIELTASVRCSEVCGCEFRCDELEFVDPTASFEGVILGWVEANGALIRLRKSQRP